MDWAQAITIIVSVLVPIFICFGWILKRFDRTDERLKKLDDRMSSMETRIAVIETILTGIGWRGGFAKTGTEREE